MTRRPGRPPWSGRALEDAELPLFRLPDPTPPAPGAVEPELAWAGPARDRLFVVQGARIAIVGREGGPLGTIRCDGVDLVRDLETGTGPVANVLLSPGRARREWHGRLGGGIETVLVAPTLPLAVIGWAGAGPSRLTLVPLPDVGTLRYRAEDGSATFAGDDNRVLALVASGPGAVWDTSELDGIGRIRLRTGEEGSAPDLLAVAYGPAPAVAAAVRATTHLRRHEERAVAKEAPSEAITLDTGAPPLDEAVHWLKHRLCRGISHAAASPLHPAEGSVTPPSEPWLSRWPDAFWAGLGASAIGDEEGALRCATLLADAGWRWASAVVAGRVALVSGHRVRASGIADALLAGRPHEARTATPPAGDRSLESLARETLADALRDRIGDADAATLRQARTRPVPGHETRGDGSSVRLPVLGGRADVDPDAEMADWLATALAGAAGTLPSSARGQRPATPGSGRGPEPSPAAQALRAWSRFGADPDEAWSLWRSELDLGMGARSRRGAAVWDDLVRRAPPAAAGLLLATLVHGWLGAVSDAPSGRLRLAPAIPRHLTRFSVRDVPVGDARVELLYRREGNTHHFDFETVRGRVPPMLVFEPRIPAPVRELRVDGVTVDRHPGDGTDRPGARLQTPLDPRRSVTLVSSG